MRNIIHDSNFRDYIQNIYKFTGLGFSLCLFVSLILSLIMPVLSKQNLIPIGIIIIINIIFNLYSLEKISTIKSIIQYNREIIPENKKLWFILFSSSCGIIIYPIVQESLKINFMIFPLTLSSTIGTFVGATYYAYSRPNLECIKWQGPLLGVVNGLIMSSLCHIIAVLLGYSQFANILDMTISVVAIITVTGLIAADTQQAIEDYNNKNMDSINTSVKLFLDCLNIFIEIMNILIELSKKDKKDERDEKDNY